MKSGSQITLSKSWWKKEAPDGLKKSGPAFEKALDAFAKAQSGLSNDAKAIKAFEGSLGDLLSAGRGVANEAKDLAKKEKDKKRKGDLANTEAVMGKPLQREVDAARAKIPSDDVEDDINALKDPVAYLAYMKKWAPKVKKRAHNFAIGLPSNKPEELRISFHPKKSARGLASKLKKEIGAKKFTFGTTNPGKLNQSIDDATPRTLILEIEGKMVPGLAKRAKLMFRQLKIPHFNKVLILENGQEIDGADDTGLDTPPPDIDMSQADPDPTAPVATAAGPQSIDPALHARHEAAWKTYHDLRPLLEAARSKGLDDQFAQYTAAVKAGNAALAAQILAQIETDLVGASAAASEIKRQLDACAARLDAVRKSLAPKFPELPRQIRAAITMVIGRISRSATAHKFVSAKEGLDFLEKVASGKATPVEIAKFFQTYCGLYDDSQQAADLQDQDKIDPARAKAFEAWIDANYMKQTGSDEQGGEMLAKALKGQTPLGALSAAEQAYIAKRIARRWTLSPRVGEDGAQTNIAELTAAVKGDPKLSKVVLDAFLDASRQARKIDVGLSNKQMVCAQQDILSAMAGAAIQLDPKQAVAYFRRALGADGLTKLAFGDRSRGTARDAQGRKVDFADSPTIAGFSKAQKNAFLTAVSSGVLDTKGRGGQTDTAGTVGALNHALVKGKTDDAKDAAGQAAWTQALTALGTRVSKLDPAKQKVLEAGVKALLATTGGRQLLLGDKIPAPMRSWAFTELLRQAEAGKITWTPQAFKDGWESSVVGQAYAKKAQAVFAKQYAKPLTFDLKTQRGLAGNTIGQMLGVPPDALPKAGETAKDRDARLNAGNNHAYYSDKSVAGKILSHIQKGAGDSPKLTPIPVSFMSNEFGTAVFKVIRTETKKGPIFYDHKGHRYATFKDWETKDDYPPGEVTYPKELVLNNPLVTRETWRKAHKVLDYALGVLDVSAMVVGTAAGIAMLVASGGTGALVAGAMVATGAYSAGRAGAKLADLKDKGHNVFDVTDPQTRGLLLELTSSLLSVGALKGGMRAAKLLEDGKQISKLGANFVATMTVAGSAVDTLAIANTVNELQRNWDKMTPAQKAQALLQLSFTFGMQAAAAKAGGGKFTDQFNFKRTRNQLEHGTPYDLKPMSDKDALPDGVNVAVKYDRDPMGNPTGSYRIVYRGDTPPSRDMILLHGQAASAMEASTGMIAKIKQYIGKLKTEPSPGTHAWEAQFELNKIAGEARILLGKLNSGKVSPAEKKVIQDRLASLNVALVKERKRLDLIAKGKGLVAAPRDTDAVALAKSYGMSTRKPGSKKQANKPVKDRTAAPDELHMPLGVDYRLVDGQLLLQAIPTNNAMKTAGFPQPPAMRFVPQEGGGGHWVPHRPDVDLVNASLVSFRGHDATKKPLSTLVDDLILDTQKAATHVDIEVQKLTALIGTEYTKGMPDIHHKQYDPAKTKNTTLDEKGWKAKFAHLRESRKPILALRDEVVAKMQSASDDQKVHLQRLKDHLDSVCIKLMSVPPDHGPQKHLNLTTTQQGNRALLGVSPTGGEFKGAAHSSKFRNASDMVDAASVGRKIVDSGFKEDPTRGITCPPDTLNKPNRREVLIDINKFYKDKNLDDIFAGYASTKPNQGKPDNEKVTYDLVMGNPPQLQRHSDGSGSNEPFAAIKQIREKVRDAAEQKRLIQQIVQENNMGLKKINYSGGKIRLIYELRDGKWELYTVMASPTDDHLKAAQTPPPTAVPDFASGTPPTKYKTLDPKTNQPTDTDYDFGGVQ